MIELVETKAVEHPPTVEPVEIKWTRLGDVASIDRRSIAPGNIADGTTYIGLENIVSGGEFLGVGPVENGELASQKFIFSPDHILYGKLRPYLAKIAMPDFAGICSTDILPVRVSDSLDKRFLAYFLRQSWVVDKVNGLASGANLPRISPKSLESIEVPVFSMAYQRRIAAILDKADHLRTQRREALAHLDALAKSVFKSMFTEISTKVTLGDLCQGRFKNGVSPSTRGTVQQKVLTLSAVTGSAFDPAAVKSSTFDKPIPMNNQVSDRLLLICRGNGNRNLVGKGYFPREDIADVGFPDTVIAAEPDFGMVTPLYLEAAWTLPSVRGQIEAAAKTTNGTFKINQKNLAAVEVPLPPLELQQTFARRVAGVERLKDQHRTQLAELDTLFASLQHRAFSGQL